MDNLNLLFGLRIVKTNADPEEPTSGTAVVYKSDRLTAGKEAWRICNSITDSDITLIDLKHQKVPDLQHFRRVYFVGPIPEMKN
jgi:hypothetical protein